MTLPPIDLEYQIDFLKRLLNTPSPTGFTDQAVALVEKELFVYPELTLERTRKGALLAWLPGADETQRHALTVHIDTLGAMVKEIKGNGRLKLTKIGGYAWNTVEGEGCLVHTRSGQTVRGSILFTKASTHVHGAALGEEKRDDASMEVRLDLRTSDAEQTRSFGIEVGDFVSFDPRVEVSHGFVRSRHLDDKACVANLVSAIHSLHQAGMKPKVSTLFHFSNYEEVGHGAAAGIPADVSELVSVDMAAIGEGQNSDEFHASLCVKDSGGPYHHGLSQKMRDLAEQFAISYKVDIYPYYGSDGEAFWRAGGDVAVALIGPGVDASHNYERTHSDALLATTQWVLAYLLNG